MMLAEIIGGMPCSARWPLLPTDYICRRNDEPRRIELGGGMLEIEVFYDNVPPRFRVRADAAVSLDASDVTIKYAFGFVAGFEFATLRPERSEYVLSC